MRYWLSLLADLLARDNRPDAARATLDAAIVAGRARDDQWWLPEVMRMRAAHDEQAAVSRLRSAAQIAVEAAAHGHAMLLLDGDFGDGDDAVELAAERAARATLALAERRHLRHRPEPGNGHDARGSGR
ncbi:MAG: hypothetical protein ACM3ML_27685 [Micromonosporaceae bacterium]